MDKTRLSEILKYTKGTQEGCNWVRDKLLGMLIELLIHIHFSDLLEDKEDEAL